MGAGPGRDDASPDPPLVVHKDQPGGDEKHPLFIIHHHILGWGAHLGAG